MDRFRLCLTLSLTLALIGALSVGCNTGTEEPDASPSTSPSGSGGGGSDSGSAGTRPSEPMTSQDIDPSRFPELAEGIEAEVPANYPSDLPIYPGAVPAQGKSAENDSGDMSAVQLLTNDPPDRAMGYYEQELESKGWTIEETKSGGPNSALSASKDGCKATFMFIQSPTGEGTDIFTISSCDDA